eukprot:PhF_6_TR32595/c0_g1_i2/m.48222
MGAWLSSKFRSPNHQRKRTRDEIEQNEPTIVNSSSGENRLLTFDKHVRSGLQYGASYIYYENEITDSPHTTENAHAKYCVHVMKNDRVFEASDLVGLVRAGHLARKPTILVKEENINKTTSSVQEKDCVLVRWIAN